MSEQLRLDEWTPPATDRFGESYSHAIDFDRLNRQARLVYDAMSNGAWWSLRELSAVTGEPEASISARIRDFKQLHSILYDKRRRGPKRGTWEYCLCR